MITADETQHGMEFAMRMSSPELLLRVWHEQPPPDMPAGHKLGLCSLGGFARAKMELRGLPAGVCSPSLPAGPECSHSLRFGQGPVFLELSKHLY